MPVVGHERDAGKAARPAQAGRDDPAISAVKYQRLHTIYNLGCVNPSGNKYCLIPAHRLYSARFPFRELESGPRTAVRPRVSRTGVVLFVTGRHGDRKSVV